MLVCVLCQSFALMPPREKKRKKPTLLAQMDSSYAIALRSASTGEDSVVCSENECHFLGIIQFTFYGAPISNGHAKHEWRMGRSGGIGFPYVRRRNAKPNIIEVNYRTRQSGPFLVDYYLYFLNWLQNYYNSTNQPNIFAQKAFAFAFLFFRHSIYVNSSL